MRPRRTRTGCLTCRHRHVKCDEVQPVCFRCQRAGQECIRGLDVKFVQGVRLTRETVHDEWDGSTDYTFDRSQQWTPIAACICFVDETEETRSWYTGIPALPPAASPRLPSPRVYASPSGPSDGGTVSPVLLQRSTSHVSFNGSVSLDRPVTYQQVISALSPTQSFGRSRASPRSPQSLQGQTPKLFDAREAFLLRHYIAALGVSLDVCDPKHHFSRVVPELATRSPLLLNAALAASAHHLCRTAGYDPTIAGTYHGRCVELLIPLLANLTTFGDDIVAAIVLLRYYEQMASAVSGSDSERHLSGASAFMNSERTCATAGGMRQASFWIFLRQDLDVALSQQRPVKLDLEAYAVSMMLEEPKDDYDWANKIVWITAEAVAFLFGPDKLRNRHEELRSNAQVWLQDKPDTFRPLYVAEGLVFPEVCYTQPYHAIAMQYYHTAMILLSIADTSRVKVGVGHRESRKLLQAEILHHANHLFGICTTGDNIQSRLGACHVVSVCAPWISDRAQQQGVIKMLSQYERDNAWPTRAIALDAMNEWEWEHEDRHFI